MLTYFYFISWGAGRIGKRTGIIFNNHMDDFALPGNTTYTEDAWLAPTTKANWIEPGKRPLSAMSPMIIKDDNGDVVLVTGGSGGARIITSAASVSLNKCYRVRETDL